MIGEHKCRLCLADVRGEKWMRDNKRTPTDVCGEARLKVRRLKYLHNGARSLGLCASRDRLNNAACYTQAEAVEGLFFTSKVSALS